MNHPTQEHPKIKSKLLEQLATEIRTRHYSRRTEKAYVDWAYRFIVFHNKRHPAEMGAAEIRQYISHLAVAGNVAASTQNQALCALLFFYRHVLQREIDHVEVIWAKKPKRMPEVFTPEEAWAVLRHLPGKYQLIGMLMYGSGLRQIESLRLRVHPVR